MSILVNALLSLKAGQSGIGGGAGARTDISSSDHKRDPFLHPNHSEKLLDWPAGQAGRRHIFQYGNLRAEPTSGSYSILTERSQLSRFLRCDFAGSLLLFEPCVFALSMNPKDPENFLRALGWPEMGAKTDLPMWKEERRKTKEERRKTKEERRKKKEERRKKKEERRKTKDERRKTKDERRKTKEERRKKKEERRKTKEERRKTKEERRKKKEERRKTKDERRKKDEGRRKTKEGRRKTEEERRKKKEERRKKKEERRKKKEERRKKKEERIMLHDCTRVRAEPVCTPAFGRDNLSLQRWL